MSSTPIESFQEIREEWEELLAACPVNTLYLTPQWQEVWWNTFSNGKQMAGFYLREPEGIMAIASLARQDDAFSLMGNPETFDYNDFLVRPGYEPTFFPKLLKCLDEEGFRSLQLYSLMESSPTLTHLPDLARQKGYSVEITEEDVAPGLELPPTWDAYLAGLSGKDRHELRRKLRRLESLEDWGWYCFNDEEEVASRLDDFLKLMRMSSPGKLEYMTGEREEFFRHITRRTAQLGLIKLFFLEIAGTSVAASLCFDYGSSRLLYNSGYDPEYSYYSVGLLLNALCLRDAIEQSKEYFDFLRGPEPYKYHLGGQNRSIYQMLVRRS
jgi:CelD/BcsL family acetyltransferase involved in cellulose biosynthesis